VEKSDWPHRAGRVTRRFHKHNDHPNRSNLEREADGAARMEKHVSIVLRFLNTQADSIRKGAYDYYSKIAFAGILPVDLQAFFCTGRGTC
jgi:hypothetical protein